MNQGPEFRFFAQSGGGTDDGTSDVVDDAKIAESIPGYRRVYEMSLVRRNTDWILAFSLLSSLFAGITIVVCVFTALAPIWPPSDAPYTFGWAFILLNFVTFLLFVPTCTFRIPTLDYMTLGVSLIQFILNLVAFLYLFLGALLNLQNLNNAAGLFGAVILLVEVVFSVCILMPAGSTVSLLNVYMPRPIRLYRKKPQYLRSARHRDIGPTRF
jgi:hypothetical protein